MRTVVARTIPVNALSVSATNVIRVPERSRLLRCDQHRDQLELGFWFEVPDVDAPPVARRFQLFDVDEPIRDGLRWVASVPLHGADEDLVLHVYEVAEDPAHQPTVSPMLGKHWASCSCGAWRSSLCDTDEAALAAHAVHVDEQAGA